MFRFSWLSLMALLCVPTIANAQSRQPTNVLFDQVFTSRASLQEFDTSQQSYTLTDSGLVIHQNNAFLKLNRYYSLAQRLVRYHLRFSPDCIAIFQSDKGDFKAIVNVTARTIQINSIPAKSIAVPFLTANHDYLVEIIRDYQSSTVRIIDMQSGRQTELSVTHDGRGGHGRGAEGNGLQAGRQYDYYCVGKQSGARLTIRQMIVVAAKTDLKLLMYGDSITEPEGYFPTASFSRSWPQLIIQRIDGAAMSSGRGGNRIDDLLLRVKNELPYIKARYVMVTIGTNGGNTEEKLAELVTYIQSQGAIPILNNIPANESGTQVAENLLIEKVRTRFNIKGCKFDLATSLNNDGMLVDKSTMYFEDYDWGKIYHHPNVKGSLQMFTRTLIDVPEIFY